MSTASVTEVSAPATPKASEWTTTEELLALPESDGVERWLLWGRLIEQPMTRRSYFHSRTEAQIAHLLKRWSEQRPMPRGMVVSGKAGFRLSRNPDFTVGIDVAYLSPELTAATPKTARFIEGLPVLAVEIISSSDRVDDVAEKIEAYLEAGVKLAWRVEPLHQIVTVFRPDAEPEGLNIHGYLDGEPHLPGFRVSVAEIFA